MPNQDLTTIEDLTNANVEVSVSHFPEIDAMGNELGTIIGRHEGKWIVWDQTHGDACIEFYAGWEEAFADWNVRVGDHIAAIREAAADA